MINHLRTLSARLITRYLPGPQVLLVRAWAWLAAETDELAEKATCLEAIVALEQYAYSHSLGGKDARVN